MPKREFNEEHKPLAYFISFRCYGTWLHGDVRGSVDRPHNIYGTPFLAPDQQRKYEEFRRLKHEPVSLDEMRRPVVEKTIREVCEHRNWLLRAINVAGSRGRAMEAHAGSGRRAASSGQLIMWSIARATACQTLMNGMTRTIETRYSTARVNARYSTSDFEFQKHTEKINAPKFMEE